MYKQSSAYTVLKKECKQRTSCIFKYPYDIKNWQIKKEPMQLQKIFDPIMNLYLKQQHICSDICN